MVNWEQVINEMGSPDPEPPKPEFKIGQVSISIGGRMVELEEHVPLFDGLQMGYRAWCLDNDML